MTYQRPEYEEVRIAHHGNAVVLRPTLRAAVTLEARFGFPAMFWALEEGNITIISEIILVSNRSGNQNAAGLLSSLSASPLSTFIGPARMPLAELVSMLMPARDPNTKHVPASGKPVAWAEYYADLYERATGWLGWTPAEAWAATPTEIERAYSGHIAKLKAIHGSGEEDKQPAKAPDPDQAARTTAEGLDPEFDRTSLRALKAKIAGGA
ncbi:hypothetical protein GOA58_07100 [Sinorhizobium meliloti]|uniref:hypothetical protein n=1 Tax=Sinorhizobium TaxID=28105 RepID=UPI001296193F|nr:hypothetical protein [Sinorhizobium medicae]MDW9447456.1 hypothetical protein [Sinorhizobium meliloti]MDW9660345.1 hypothetical protein [Sinorhizobium meliloti]MDX0049914.1 hypothetical protein [Sinorhizobium meliloti]MQV98361.1 hypothetical protein [Sinorhizobium medicae]